jgi:hypothetical protein
MDEHVAPLTRRIMRLSYSSAFGGAALTLLSSWADSSVGLLIGVVVFVPAFLVAWAGTVYVFLDMTAGSYLRYRRMVRRDRVEQLGQRDRSGE